MLKFVFQAWRALNKLDKIWKSFLPDELKGNFLYAAAETVYGATIWTLTATLEKNLLMGHLPECSE